MNTIIFSKYSNDRGRRFSVRTDILEDEEGNRCVRKIPAFPEAEAHVASLVGKYQNLLALTEHSRLSFDRCVPAREGVKLDYLTGPSLESWLLQLLHQEGEEACAEAFLHCLQFLRSLHTGAVFEPTDAFLEVFGEIYPAKGTVCAPCTDIDLLCENIIVEDDSWIAIDYEWTFDFPVPVNYLLYRVILHFTDNANRGEEFRRFDFMGQMGITGEEQKIYAAMESHFQQYILQKHVPIRNLYDDVSEGFVLADDFTGYESLQIYNNSGDGFSEENSVFYPMHFVGHWIAKREHPIPEGTSSLRIDPGFRSCMVHLKMLRFDNQAEQAPFFLREGSILGDWIFFGEEDPNLFIGTIPEGAHSLLIEYDLYDTDPQAMEEVRKRTDKIQLLADQSEAQASQIRELLDQDARMTAQMDQMRAQYHQLTEQMSAQYHQLAEQIEQIHAQGNQLTEQMSAQNHQLAEQIEQIRAQGNQLTEQVSALNQNIFIRIGRKLHGLSKAGNRRKEN